MFGMRVTAEDSYFVLDGVQIRPWKWDTSLQFLWNVADLVYSFSIRPSCRFVVDVDLLYNISTCRDVVDLLYRLSICGGFLRIRCAAFD